MNGITVKLFQKSIPKSQFQTDPLPVDGDLDARTGNGAGCEVRCASHR
jgi:hypothetical protein